MKVYFSRPNQEVWPLIKRCDFTLHILSYAFLLFLIFFFSKNNLKTVLFWHFLKHRNSAVNLNLSYMKFLFIKPRITWGKKSSIIITLILSYSLHMEPPFLHVFNYYLYTFLSQHTYPTQPTDVQLNIWLLLFQHNLFPLCWKSRKVPCKAAHQFSVSPEFITDFIIKGQQLLEIDLSSLLRFQKLWTGPKGIHQYNSSFVQNSSCRFLHFSRWRQWLAYNNWQNAHN